MKQGASIRSCVVLLFALALTMVETAVPGHLAFASSGPMVVVNPEPAAFRFNSIVYGQGIFVVGGSSGLETSRDGVQWAPVPGIRDYVTQVLYEGGTFLALGSTSMLTSPDGVNWTRTEPPPNSRVSGAAYGKGQFVAIGSKGAVISSPSGRTWSKINSTTQANFYSIAFGNDQFVASGYLSGKTVMFRSSDGASWEETFSIAGYNDSRLTFIGGKFFTDLSGSLYESSDGRSWITASTPPTGSSNHPKDVRRLGDRVLLFADRQSYVTTDGALWSQVTLDIRGTDGQPVAPAVWDAVITSAVKVSGSYYGVGLFPGVATSGDGATWRVPSSGTQANLTSVAYGAGRFVAVGEESTDGKGQESRTMVYISEDGTHWSGQPFSAGKGTRSLRFLGGRFFALGTESLLTSTDGITWSLVAKNDVFHYLNAAAYGAGTYIAVGGRGTIMRSDDGSVWTPISTGISEGLRDVVYHHGQFFAAGSGRSIDTGGGLWTSKDGRTWEALTFPPELRIERFATNETVLVATGTRWTPVEGRQLGYYTSFRSVDGVTWTTENTAFIPSSLTYADSRFVAGDSWGELRTSMDGTSWEVAAKPIDVPVNGVAFGSGKWVGVGLSGNIFGGTLPSPCGKRFTDLPSTAPSCKAVENLAAQTVINGYIDGRFGPNDSVKRAEFAKMLVLALGLKPDPTTSLPFTDTAGHWAATGGYLQTAVALKAISGTGDGTFQPEAPLTRSQIIKIAAAAGGINVTGAHAFRDVPTGSWYAPWVSLGAAGQLIGSNARTPIWTVDALEPEKPCTRGEAAIVLANLIAARR